MTEKEEPKGKEECGMEVDIDYATQYAMQVPPESPSTPPVRRDPNPGEEDDEKRHLVYRCYDGLTTHTAALALWQGATGTSAPCYSPNGQFPILGKYANVNINDWFYEHSKTVICLMDRDTFDGAAK